jgi:hypothetical protein
MTSTHPRQARSDTNAEPSIGTPHRSVRRSTIWHPAYVPELHLEVHYGVDLASDASPVTDLCAALVDLSFGPAGHVVAC